MVHSIRHRWDNHKDNARNFERGENGMQRHVYEPFTRSLRVFKQC